MAKKEFLKAGDLDTLIKLYNVNRTQNDYGETIDSLVFSKDIWAKLVLTGTKGNEKVEDDTLRAESKINFLVREDSVFNLTSINISPEQKMVIKYENKYWNTISVESQGRGMGVIIRCNFTDNDYPEHVI